MRESIEVCFDGNKYLVCDFRNKAWGEGVTLEQAYIDFKYKSSNNLNPATTDKYFFDISFIWLSYRKIIIIILFICALIYAQIAIFTSLPFYLFNSIGSTFAEKVVFAANKVSDRVDSMSAVERNKIQLSLNRLYNSLSQLQSDTDCKQVIIKNKSP